MTTSITEAILRSNVFKYGRDITLEEGTLGARWIIRDKSGQERFRIESPELKQGLIIRDVKTRCTVTSSQFFSLLSKL